ncbi:MAG: ABC transporter ATP-binding protein [Clostridia bacterium]|nr:ABC transporter ATP-binding protein [Clostridia bacterium]
MTVTVNNVSKLFIKNGTNSVQALQDINLEIREGEFICFLGPSGCGKSTLLNIIAGLEKNDGGSIQVDGTHISGAGPDRVVVFQEAALFPWLTVQKNVEFGLKMLGVDKAERAAIALKYLQMVHLGRFVDAYPHELSGGMKQRVAIARALAMNPKILLMDEPFAALDAQTRSLLHKELQEIWAQTGKTIIFVTHNVAEAACLADRIVLFTARPGKIKKEFNVQLARPRVEGNPNLVYLQNEIMGYLAEEIEKVAREEIDYGYSLGEKPAFSLANQDQGSGI